MKTITTSSLYIFILTMLFSCLYSGCSNNKQTKNNNSKIETVEDPDGNLYKIVKIGNQTWMAENLKTELYNDGTPISKIESNNDWVTTEEPGYCWYNNNKEEAINKVYGALYNFQVVQTNKICPQGWHVPDWNEWQELLSVINNDGNSADSCLKATSGWTLSNGTDLYGFSATPSGERDFNDGTYKESGSSTSWWCATQGVGIMLNNDGAYQYLTKISSNEYMDNIGNPIRCVKDEVEMNI